MQQLDHIVRCYTIRIDDQSKHEIRLPNYLFVEEPIDKETNYFVSLIKNKQKWEISSSLKNIKIRVNRKEVTSLDKLILYVEKDGVITRQIEFSKEK